MEASLHRAGRTWSRPALALAAVLAVTAAAGRAPAATPSPQAEDPLEAPRLLREGRLAEARAAFAARLATSPADADAAVGLGFTALRQDRVDEAAALFRQVVARAPAYADAHFGLALCAERQGWPDAAAEHLARALALDAGRAELVELQRRLEGPPLPALPPARRSADPQPAFRVSRAAGFEVRAPEGWRSTFLKGINLGAALPGRFPSQFPPRQVYAAWLGEIAEAGFDVVRVYTIHPPWFYEALREHNLRAPRPLYLVHGVWAEPPPRDDFADPWWRAGWNAEIRRAVDVVHGRANLPPRPGHAAGAYRADVSGWVLAWILGREWEPDGVAAFDAAHPGQADFQGRFVRCTGAQATERVMAESLEHLLAAEQDGYGVQRPAAYTSWPTLDPLHHPTEATKAEEAALRRRLGLPLEKGRTVVEYDNDAVGLDLEKLGDGPELTAGLFASYHAYPYYPDFIGVDPGYGRPGPDGAVDHYGAYLADLVRHHRRHAVLVAEFGVPSSRLVAHWQPEGFHHGGQGEREQGEQDARLFRTIHAAGCAGGILFAWIDEWFKKNWLVIDHEVPADRKPLWFNAMDAEEGYGLVGLHPGEGGPSIVIDGKAGDWAAVPDYLAGAGLRLRLLADEGWLHVAVLRDDGGVPGEGLGGGGLLVGLDTHGLALGDHALPRHLPLGAPPASAAGLEAVLVVRDGTATVLVDEPYDLFTHRFARPHRSVENRAGRYLVPRTESNRQRLGRDGTVFPARVQEIGALRRGTLDRADPAFDSRAEWATGPGLLEARIPWGLLNVGDPSSRRVIRDAARPGPVVGTQQTDGLRALLVRFEAGAGGTTAARGRITASLPAVMAGTIPAPPLFTWPEWTEPRFHAFHKRSFDLVRSALSQLPGAPLPPR